MTGYQEIASRLRQAITDGAYRRGDLLPGEMPLAAAYEVSRTTVRRALAELERDGIVRVSPGRGRFVGPPLPEPIVPARPNRTETLAAFLKAAISSGEWRPGARLPGEASIAATYGVARVTVRSALALLAKDGLIVTRQGVGSIVQSRDHLDAHVQRLVDAAPPITQAQIDKLRPLFREARKALADRNEPNLT